MKKFIYTFLLLLLLTGCAKKYDWVCSCEIYTSSSSSVHTKEIKHQSQSDASAECSKFGESEAGVGGAHDCSTKVK